MHISVCQQKRGFFQVKSYGSHTNVSPKVCGNPGNSKSEQVIKYLLQYEKKCRYALNFNDVEYSFAPEWNVTWLRKFT